MGNGLENLIKEINNKSVNFIDGANKQLNGNKAAGQRARKISLEIEKLLKEFRKASIKE